MLFALGKYYGNLSQIYKQTVNLDSVLHMVGSPAVCVSNNIKKDCCRSVMQSDVLKNLQECFVSNQHQLITELHDGHDIRNTMAYFTAPQINEICYPLFKATPVNYFVYLRYYSDNKCMLLLSDEKWLEHYFVNFYPIFSTFVPEGLHLWNNYMPLQAQQEGAKIFNHHNGVILLKKFPNFTEQIELASSCMAYSPIELLNNPGSILQNFIFYFRERANDLIAQASRERIMLSSQMHGSAPECGGSVQEKDLRYAIKPKKVYMYFNNNEITLSPREYECLKLLSHGDTSKEVARSLEISSRTVETHLINAKIKTQIYSTTDLFNQFRENLL